MNEDADLIEASILSHNDRNSVVWAKLKKHMEAALMEARIKNDNDRDPIATAKLRGEIRCLKNLLALETAQAMVADEG